MKLPIEIRNTENVEDLSQSDIREIEEMVGAVLQVGGFTGVRGGKTILHFDHNGIFQRVELSYNPWVRRKT